MFKILTKIPNDIGLAFSGGVDSLAIAHFLKMGKKNVTLYHFNHMDEYSPEIEYKCCHLADLLHMKIVVDSFSGDIPKGRSIEDVWRRARYRFLRSCDQKIITGHHLDDAVETWVWSSLHGEGKLIPVESANIIRPFLTTEKQTFINYCKNNNLDPVEDECNKDLSLMRNYMRANMMEHLYKINPGLKTVIRKKYQPLKESLK
ncbi:tRNA lysidine(34) synthetase TilS [Candidatus Dojkabacteria bacterium]|uniref:tRNA(Ile)-lysidine synthetase n=1 Tax=Candidatus Dojkabacteria bacterium TaxID=2099670 RepID=A0A5C7JAN2_9BACT|nr:MAG: tRNA lysidine(34) synthetase TilS [Candidatus Dojkabacteria bacterium]